MAITPKKANQMFHERMTREAKEAAEKYQREQEAKKTQQAQ